MGIALIVIRFAKGLGAITNLTQEVPWGLWIGFDVVTGVAFAGGAYVITFIVYILNNKRYESIVRATVLNGFLAYVFYAGALLLDLGRPWNVINPIIGNNFGVSSVLFLVAWHFMLYMMAELIEFSPAIAEWIGARRARNILSGMTLAAVIFGITLSTLHQSGLGALYLMAKEKIHPLWYSEFIPVLFFVSSIFAGLSMVIFEGSISHRVFFDQISPENRRKHHGILHGLARICGFTMFAYFFLQVLVFVHGKHWDLLEHPDGLLVSDRDARLRSPAHAPVLLQLPAPEHVCHQAGRCADHVRDHHQPRQCDDHRVSLGCLPALRAVVDGIRGDTDGAFRRSMDLQVDRQPPPGTEGSRYHP